MLCLLNLTRLVNASMEAPFKAPFRIYNIIVSRKRLQAGKMVRAYVGEPQNLSSISGTHMRDSANSCKLFPDLHIPYFGQECPHTYTHRINKIIIFFKGDYISHPSLLRLYSLSSVHHDHDPNIVNSL